MAIASTICQPFPVSRSMSIFLNSALLDPTKTAEVHQRNRNPSTDKPMAPSITPTHLTSQDLSQSNTALATLSSRDHDRAPSTAVGQNILGPNRDGRVRNPVPRKLKGKTDIKQGNFSVMQMGSSSGKKDAYGRDIAAERDAAALKTSEATAYRAKAAQSDRYVPPKRRSHEGVTNNPIIDRILPPEPSRKLRTKPLAPAEIKLEQTRLLSLLRNISPITVVDQICKAIAYFGGIPGAPPPKDGVFPQSANTKDTGALFIEWLAEIFPDLSVQSSLTFGNFQFNPEINARDNKKDPQAEITLSEASGSNDGYSFGMTDSRPATGTPTLTLVSIPNSIDLKRRRGRPKGSRNKKSIGALVPENTSSNQTSTSRSNYIEPALKSPTPKQLSDSNLEVPVTKSPKRLLDQQSCASKVNLAAQFEDVAWSSNQQQVFVKNVPNTVLPPGNKLSAEECAILEAFRDQNSKTLNDICSPVIASKGTPDAEKKRKRELERPKVTSSSTTAGSTTVSTPTLVTCSSQKLNSTNHPPNPPDSESLSGGHLLSKINPNIIAKGSLHWASVESSQPAPKRVKQDKTKLSPLNASPSQNLITSNTKPSTTHASSKADNQTSISQQSSPISQPPPEGLEAHYERFTNLQQHTNNGKFLPNSISHQRINQQLEPSSTPSQRDDLKADQGGPPSASLYCQGPQASSEAAPYTQRLSSRQSSQFYYRHQASPKPNNSAFQSANLQHTTQSSSQCPIIENNFRIPSPHTISQPSPSYSQQENVYRSPSTHSTLQPTPSFSSSHPQAQPSQQNYSQFSDSGFINLPNSDSLGHSGNIGNLGVPQNVSGFNQSITICPGSSQSPINSGLYVTSPGLNSHDTSLNRGISRNSQNVNVLPAASNSNSNNNFNAASSRGMRSLMRSVRRS